MGRKSDCFWPEKPLKFSILGKKSLRISAKTFFWRSPVFGRKNRLNFQFWPEKAFGFRRKPFFFFEITCFWLEKSFKFSILQEKAFGFRRRPFFFGDHLIFTKKWSQSESGTMKIWVKFVHGTNFQKILPTCLFFAEVQSTLKKRPPIQNFTI